MKDGRLTMTGLYTRLFLFFGPQGWWPGESPFEVAAGAILTQNTSWRGAERAIARLKAAGFLSPRKMAGLPPGRLASLIRPAGCCNLKSRRLKNFLSYLEQEHRFSMEDLAAAPPGKTREGLLGVNGIGPETADSILLYAASRPFFVIDAYTRRIFSRHHLVSPAVSYEALQEYVVTRIPEDVSLYKQFHALLVALGKEYCRPGNPRCGGCPLDPPDCDHRRGKGGRERG
jgi:endonuclease-3 related protein